MDVRKRKQLYDVYQIDDGSVLFFAVNQGMQPIVAPAKPEMKTKMYGATEAVSLY